MNPYVSGSHVRSYDSPSIYTVQEIESRHYVNSNINTQESSTSHRTTRSNNFIDISNSNLQPTATEFRPSSSYSNETTQENVPNNGAIKKQQPRKQNYKPREYNNRNYNRNNKEKYYNNSVENSANGESSSRHSYRDERQQTSYEVPEPPKYDKRHKEKYNNSASEQSNSRHSYRDERQQTSYEVTEPPKYDKRNKEKYYNNSVENSTNGQSNSRHSYKDERQQTSYEISEPPKSDKRQTNRGNYNNYYRDNYNKDNWYNKKRNFRSNENWREPRNDNTEVKIEKNENKKIAKINSKSNPLKTKLNAASQRERLIEMLTHKILECLVCCEKLRHTDKVWSCKQCYHILHLNCVLKWARSSKLESGWRCPACQNVCLEVPKEYRCFCGNCTNPTLESGVLPHSCGELCTRKRRQCDHPCPILCHPGPCPDCTAMVTRSCGCGATKPMVKCGSDLKVTCSGICNKLLNCQLHQCSKICHVSDCTPCAELIKQECYCGKENRELPCTVDGIDKYKCSNVCDKLMACNNHNCKKLCHDGDCDVCKFDPKVVKTCPCEQTKLTEERTSCLDPIPCCDKICNKILKCGSAGESHYCKLKCHDGECVTCPLETSLRCRCGHMLKTLTCKEFIEIGNDIRCQKRCTKKRACYKHKCNQTCCIDIDHPCSLLCNRTLSCGTHKCKETCHRGNCSVCWRTSFDELYCECGSSVLYPPVACGTKPPPCNQPCIRERPCGHPSYHNCHTGACPVCTIFTTRYCHGKHESRNTIPCHQDDFSCGRPCGKLLACGRHKCLQNCHKGDCPMPCSQPCTIQRTDCEHNCNQPCHEPPCVLTSCKLIVTVTCQCGLRTGTRICNELYAEYQKIAMVQIASKMSDTQRGQPVDISEIVNIYKKGGKHKTMDCNDECRLIERNRRLAIGLQIRNPDLSAKLTPRYSDFIRAWGKKNSKFCDYVHSKISDLVQLAKQSKQKSRIHSFECMQRDKRHFVKEYCEHFGCESVSFDKEPNRNVVVTAFRDKSWLPSVSIIQLLQRENGQRKVPGPVLNKLVSSNSKDDESVSVRLQSRTRTATPPTETIDYFDNPPQ